MSIHPYRRSRRPVRAAVYAIVLGCVLASWVRDAVAAPTPDPAPTPDAAPAASAAAPAASATAPAPLPLPTAAGGLATRPSPSLATRLRWVPRVVLAPPRWGFWLAAQPVRLGAWAYERFHLEHRLERGIVQVGGFGVWPTASYDSSGGIAFGARALHADLFGAGERLLVDATGGDAGRQAYRALATSGARLGDRVTATLEGRLERRPRERFYGLGNADDLAAMAAAPVDPSLADTAIDTRYREHLAAAVATVDARIAGGLSVRLTGALVRRRFDVASPAMEDAITTGYDTTRLTGYATGGDHGYGELELAYDSRRPGSPYQSAAFDATGWLAAARVGYAGGIAGDRTDHVRYGLELQRFLDLWRGSRVLALRVFVDGVTGTDGRTDGEIAFVDLPRLGGSEDLRGYVRGRFRDRVAALASAEYRWDLGSAFAAYAFVDAGRVARIPSELAEGALHVGYGAGLQLHTHKSFVGRGQIAVSDDGDVMFQLALSPAFGRRERAGRY